LGTYNQAVNPGMTRPLHAPVPTQSYDLTGPLMLLSSLRWWLSPSTQQ